MSKSRNVSINIFVKKWLLTTFEENENCNLDKEQVYLRYVEFCDSINIKPSKNNMFSKMIKKVFPQTKNRRLGPRGKGKPFFSGFGFKKKLQKKSQRSLSSLNESEYKAYLGICKLMSNAPNL